MLVHVLVLVSQLLRAAAVEAVRHVSCHATLLVRARPRADQRVLLRTLFHVPPHALSGAARGLVVPSTTLPPSARCAWRSLAPELACSDSSRFRRHPSSVRSHRGPECGCDRALHSLWTPISTPAKAVSESAYVTRCRRSFRTAVSCAN